MGIFNERKEKIIDCSIRISVTFSYKTTYFYHARYMFQPVMVLFCIL
jgi:hypothetical protein